MAQTPPTTLEDGQQKPMSFIHSGSAPGLQPFNPSSQSSNVPSMGTSPILSSETEDGANLHSASPEKRVVPVRLQQMREKMERLKHERKMRKHRQRKLIANSVVEEKSYPQLDHDESYRRPQHVERGVQARYGVIRDNRVASRFDRENRQNKYRGVNYSKPRRKLKPLYLRKEEEYKAKMEAKEQQKILMYNKWRKQRLSMPTAEELREHRRICDERRRNKQASAKARALERKAGRESKARQSRLKHKQNGRERNLQQLRRDQSVAYDAEALRGVENRAENRLEGEATMNARTLTDAYGSEAIETTKQATILNSSLQVPFREAPELPTVNSLLPLGPTKNDQVAQPEQTPERANRLPIMISPTTKISSPTLSMTADSESHHRSPERLIDMYFASVSEKIREIGRDAVKKREEKKYLEATPPNSSELNKDREESSPSSQQKLVAEVKQLAAANGIAPPVEILLSPDPMREMQSLQIESVDKKPIDNGAPLSGAMARIPIEFECVDDSSSLTA